MAPRVVLGVETSCDETGVGVVQRQPGGGLELLADVTASSMAEHARYGGIIPEIASRAHLEAMVPTLRAALAEAGVGLDAVEAVAVTAGPGLIGSLTVGAASAKALALAISAPLYGVNHVLAHLAVDQLAHGPFPARFVGLVVSGGHSSLLLVDNIATAVTELGSTLDDAAGEAFDKVGRLLGLPYPAGPHIDRLAQGGNPVAIRFPRGLSAPKYAISHPYDFSFSGLKTAVARYFEAEPAPDSPASLEDVSASFAAAVVEVLVAKAVRACQAFGVDTVVVGGGFSANTQLREALAAAGAAHGLTVRVPPRHLCTDNGAMIAALGAELVSAGVAPSPPRFSCESVMDLTEASLV